MNTVSVAAARRTGGRFDQQKLVLVLLLLAVSILVLGPVLVLIRASFAPAESMPLETLDVTLLNYAQLLSSPRTLTMIWNTGVYALSSMAIGVAIATAIAWCTERTDMSGRIVVRILMFAWMMVPALVVGFGWILLLNPGNGALNVMFRELFGFLRPVLTIYSFWSLIIVTSFAVVPTAFVMISGLLRNMDPYLEQAARVHGGNSWATLTRVTLPLLTPGLFSIGIYMFMAVVQAFDLPLIIGLSADVAVLSTRVYLLSSPDNGLPNYGLASAFGVLLLVVAGGLMWTYMRATRLGERFRVVTGKAFRPRRIKLGRWRFAALAFTFGYCAVMMLPLLILFWVSLQSAYTTPSLSALGGLSFDIYRRLLTNPMISRAVVNTIILVVSSATIVMVISCLIGWFTVRSNSKAGKLLDALSFLPMAIPPIVLVLAILLLYLDTPLYGTIWILVLGHVTIYIAFGVRTMSSALIQIHKELGDAALISGASWLTSLRKVVFPLVWPQIVNGWLWVFAHSARDLTVPLMLMSSGNLVAASTLWNLWQFPDLPGAAALAILLMAALLVVVVPSQLYVARRLER